MNNYEITCVKSKLQCAVAFNSMFGPGHLRQQRNWGPNDAVGISVTFRVNFRVAISTHLRLEEVGINHKIKNVAFQAQNHL